jgi:RND family efflux transporter MFP subunit
MSRMNPEPPAAPSPPRRFRRDRILAGIIVLAAIGGYALLMATRAPPAPVQPAEQAWRVTVEPLRYGEFAPSLLVYGQLESPASADLSANISADVEAVAVLEGDSVRKGQLLVRLDAADPEIRVRGDEAALRHERELLALAKKDLERNEQLFKDGLASAANVDAARQTVEQRALAVAAREQSLAAARLTLERTRVQAPFAGRVTRVAVAAGDRVQTGQLLVSLYDPSRLELRAPLPQPLLPRIQAALSARGTLPASAAQDGASVSGQLVRLSAAARSGSGNVDGFFRFAQGHPDWEPGRSLAITLTLPPVAEVAAIPYEALYGRNRIYLVEGGRMKGITVETVGEYREPGGKPRLLVRGPGLSGGLPLIITQVPRAVDGLKVITAESAS